MSTRDISPMESSIWRVNLSNMFQHLWLSKRFVKVSQCQWCATVERKLLGRIGSNKSQWLEYRSHCDSKYEYFWLILNPLPHCNFMVINQCTKRMTLLLYLARTSVSKEMTLLYKPCLRQKNKPYTSISGCFPHQSVKETRMKEILLLALPFVCRASNRYKILFRNT